ncbi:diphthine--ammonia ligase [Bacillus sp. FJAT-22090]|uniref:Dph6-related ATP pyrophosphatase n=1 Tax=Bacillus sp. FJAT-22090 TaxID=1581038 RepID=UPI0011AA2439|nr:diphthine--ammonia ligase [Bacillus sp. FJAT-22090]
MKNTDFVASWSGGKDSALAYYRALKLGMIPKKVLTMFEEEGEISKSHALPLEVVQAQVERLGVPLITMAASWGTYEEQFTYAMDACRAEGITHGVFGDIDLEGHLEWVLKTCAKSDITAVHPLWQMPRKQVVDQLLEEEFEAWIVVVNTKMMPASYVGKKLSKEIVEELDLAGIDACGENGEFHTIVVDGPLFSSRLPITLEKPVEKGDYVFTRVTLEG